MFTIDKKQGGTMYKKLRIAGTPYRKRYGKKDRREKIPDRSLLRSLPLLSIKKEDMGTGKWIL
jgi:hypothetical protein